MHSRVERVVRMRPRLCVAGGAVGWKARSDWRYAHARVGPERALAERDRYMSMIARIQRGVLVDVNEGKETYVVAALVARALRHDFQ